jgi:hypothetical protein
MRYRAGIPDRNLPRPEVAAQGWDLSRIPRLIEAAIVRLERFRLDSAALSLSGAVMCGSQESAAVE